MIHVPEEIYESLAEAIRNLQAGYWAEGPFSAVISVMGHYEQYFTGVEDSGVRERYYEPVVDYWDVKDFSAYDEDGNEAESDFDTLKIEI